MSNKTLPVLLLLFGVLLLGMSCNPFAPRYDADGLTGENFLGDRTNVDGLFTYFKNSYELRDTSLYGKLFSSDFVFTYYDFDQAADVNWDKAQEMALTYNLFRNVQQISLDWNFYVQRDTTETDAAIVRAFNLTIVENESTVYTGTGRARITLRRDFASEPWQITSWFDDSDF